MSSQELTFSEVVKNRYSARAFLPSPIPRDALKDILLEAQCAPSNCNTQPWSLHIVAGDKLRELSHALTEDLRTGNYSLDFTFDKEAYPDRRYVCADIPAFPGSSRLRRRSTGSAELFCPNGASDIKYSRGFQAALRYFVWDPR